MKKNIALYLKQFRIKSLSFFAPVVLAFLIGLTSCGSNPSLTNVTPIYQGMTIERPQATQNLRLEANSDSGEEPGSGEDVKVDDEDIDEDEIDVDIEDIIEIDVETTESVEYFVVKNETFRIALNIYNPSQFEILSFTINGYKYANNMFAPGSNLTKVLVEVTASDESGIFDYTVDAIKYVDGTDIKDVRMEGEKTIKTAIRYDEEPTIQVINQSVGTKSLNLDLFASDPNGLIGENLFKFYLSNGIDIIYEKDLVKGANQVELNNLLLNKAYQYAVKAVYDVCDGKGLVEKTLIKEEFSTLKGLLIRNVEVGQEDVSFDFNKVEDSATINSISLHEVTEGYPQVASTDVDNLFFSGLLSNHDYYLAVKYSYTTGDKTEIEIEVVRVKTLTKATPIIDFSSITSEHEAINFALAISDLDSVGSVTSVKLLKDDVKVGELTYGEGTNTFSGLLSNNLYTIKVTYTYNLNDGVGNQVITITREVRTLTKSTPEVTIFDVSSTQTSISFNLDVVDGHNVGNITKIELYKGTNLIDTYDFIEAEWPDMFVFENLLSNNLYTIKVTYTYDLNDGIGAKTLVTTYDQPTLAEGITVSGIDILNTTNPKVGEEIHIRILLDNPDNILIRSFFINGIEYSSVGGNVTESAIIKFIPKNFIGGEYEVKIDAITYLSHNRLLTQLITSEFSDNIIVLGSIDAVRIYNFDNNIIYSDLGEKYIYIDFVNPTNYDLSEITINGYVFDQTNITKIQQATFRVDYIWGSSTELILNSFKYGISGQEQSLKEISTVRALFTVVTNSVYREISTPTQLANVESGYAYKLINDIDLTSYSWISKSFSGVINGQGFAIKNFALVIENESESDQYYGLFSNFHGVLHDTVFEDVYLSVNTKGDSTVGVVTGIASESIFERISVFGIISNNQGHTGGLVGLGYNTTISSSYNSGTVSGSDQVGGLVGQGHNTTISGSYNSGSVSGSNSVGGLVGLGYNTTISGSYNSGTVSGSDQVGGLVGLGQGYTTTISGSYNSGAVSGSNFVGGLVGQGHNTTISSSYNSGAVSGSDQVGGLVGYGGYGYNTTISGSYNSGSVSGSSGYVGGLVGSGGNTTISGSYNSGAVSGSNEVGGLVGQGYTTTISGSYNSGAVSGSNFVGGLVGQGHNTTISSSYNSGAVSGSVEVGGLVGEGSTAIYIYYSLNFGDVTTSYITDYIGGIIGYSIDNFDQEHVYHTGLLTVAGVEVNGFDGGVKVDDLTVFNQDFFVTTLGWDIEIWDFTNLDIANGVYPILR